LYDEYL
jgi:hypothetical protein